MARSTPTSRRLASGLALAALAAVGAGCSGTPVLRVEDPVAKASPSFGGACAVFLSIVNRGDGDDVLLEAHAEVPGAVTQLHATRDGRMAESGAVVVPARGVLELRPGGLHIMVFHLPGDSGPGYEFTLRLRFERSGERRASVRIAG